MIEVTNISKSFRPGQPVLDGLSLKIAAKERLAIVGPSGSGKSTLLHILGTLEEADSGSVVVDGQTIGTLNEQDRTRLRRERIGFVFQAHHLLPQCTVLENVLLPTLATGGATDAQTTRARDLLARVGLAERSDHRPAQLSGGECQRTAVVRALIHQPAILLADEPTGALDANTASGIVDLLLELNEDEGCVLVVVTHDQTVAARLGRQCSLVDGRLAPDEARP